MPQAARLPRHFSPSAKLLAPKLRKVVERAEVLQERCQVVHQRSWILPQLHESWNPKFSNFGESYKG